MFELLVLPETLFDAWELYLEYLQVNNLDIAYLARTALFRYTLSGYGLPEKVTKSEILDFMKTIPLAQFVDALNVQQNVFDFLDTKKYSQRSNRHRLKQMLDWCSAQDWWKLAAQGKQYAPRRRNNLGNAHHVKLINRTKHQRFSLKNIEPEDLSDIWKQINPDSTLDNLNNEIEQFREAKERIQKEIKQLRKFQISIQFRKRQDKAMKEVTADKIERRIYSILGWLYFYERQPLKNLGLHCFDNIDLAYGTSRK